MSTNGDSRPAGGGADAAIDRATRVLRMLTWLVAFACSVLALSILVSASAHAEDPRAAARALGRAGQTAAGAIAKDAAKPAAVPGYAGTDVPERNLTAAGMEGAARARLADPARPAGAAGRTVVEGVTVRPPADVQSTDAVVVRSEGIAASPQSLAHRADGLASGSVSECGAGVADAGTGGRCGSVTSCVGAGCESVGVEANTGFVDAAANLNMVLEMGGEEFDRADMQFFKGERRACRIRFGGLANCCRNSGLLVGLANCSAAEVELAKERNAGNTHYLGRRCAKRVFGVCIRRERVWCVFGSKLGRILHQQARPQLGIGWSSCRGFTVAEVERIDFDALDLTEFTEDLADGGKAPSIALPGAGDTRTLMRDRIRDFYTSGE